MPITDLMRLAARHDLSGRIMGMPPPTAPSNIKSTLCSSASGNSSLPYFASTSLLAVTTFFPCSSAEAIYSFAGCSRPISSTTISMSGSFTISSKSPVTAYFLPSSAAFCGLRTNIFFISILQPAFLAISPPLCSSTCSTPLPTVPTPKRPILIQSFICSPRN